MFINRLALRDFRTVSDKIFFFKKGFNLISGANGTGKSSIMLALSYLLLNHTVKTVDDYVKWKRQSFEVSTDIDFQGKVFKATVERINGKTNKTLYIDDEAYHDSDATTALSEYFDPAFCKTAFLAFQGEEDLITSKPAERRESLKKIYDLTFTHQIKELEDELVFLKSDKIVGLTDKITKLQAKDYTPLDYDDLPLTEGAYKLGVSKIALLKAEIEKLKIEYKVFEEKKEKKETILVSISTKRGDSQKLGFELAQKRSDKVKAEEQLEEVGKNSEVKRNKLEAELAAIVVKRLKKVDNTPLVDFYKQEKEASFKLREIKNHLELISQGKCPTCGNEFDSRVKEEYDRDKIKYAALVASLTTSITDLEDLYATYQKELKTLEEKTALRLSLTKDLENLENVSKVEKEKFESQTTLLSETIEDKMAQVDKCLESISNLNEDLADTEKLLVNEVVFPRSEISSLAGEERAIQEYDTIVLSNAKSKKHNIALLKRQKEDTKVLANLSDQKEVIQTDIGLYKRAIEILKRDLPNHIISSMLGNIEEGMNEFLEKTYKGRYKVAIQETKTGIEFLYADKKASVLLASGAEKQIMNVGMKVAYNKLSGLKVLFLDEVDSQMSEDISREVFSSLYEMHLDGYFDQIFVITHQESTKELIENNFHAKVFEL